MAKIPNEQPLKYLKKKTGPAKRERPKTPPRQYMGGPIKSTYHGAGQSSGGGSKPGFFDKLPAEHVLGLVKKIGKSISKKPGGKKKSRSIQTKTNRFAR